MEINTRLILNKLTSFPSLAIAAAILGGDATAETCSHEKSKNLVRDCGFEAVEDVTDAGWMKFFADSALGGWIVTVGEIDIQDNDHSGRGGGMGHGGALGLLHIDLNTEGSTISQKIESFEPGREYEISFGYAMHDLIDRAEARVSVSEVLEEQLFSVRPGQLNWQKATFNFKATSTVHTLSFMGIGEAPGNGMLIDNVFIVRVD